MLKKSASGVLASLRGATRGICGGAEPIRSHVIEASGSSKAWYVPPRLFARCGVACGTVRLGAPGWVGENRGHFEHPAVLTSSEPYDKISAVIHAYTEFFRSPLVDWGCRDAKSLPAWKFRMSPFYLSMPTHNDVSENVSGRLRARLLKGIFPPEIGEAGEIAIGGAESQAMLDGQGCQMRIGHQV